MDEGDTFLVPEGGGGSQLLGLLGLVDLAALAATGVLAIRAGRRRQGNQAGALYGLGLLLLLVPGASLCLAILMAVAPPNPVWDVPSAVYPVVLLIDVVGLALLGYLAVQAGGRRSGAWAVALYVIGLVLPLVAAGGSSM